MSKKKDKSMSKRELVSYIHALTGLSFKESRILCKKARYIYPRAYWIALAVMFKRGLEEGLSRENELKLPDIIFN